MFFTLTHDEAGKSIVFMQHDFSLSALSKRLGNAAGGGGNGLENLICNQNSPCYLIPADRI